LLEVFPDDEENNAPGVPLLAPEGAEGTIILELWL